MVVQPQASADHHLKARREVLLDRHVKTGWLLILVGLIVPVIAIGGALYGVGAVRSGRQKMGALLILAGLAVFAIRLTLWVGS